MCIDESQHQDPRKQITVNKMQVIEMLHSVIDVAKVNEVSTKDVNMMIESMFKEAGMKNKKVQKSCFLISNVETFAPKWNQLFRFSYFY